MAIATLTIDLVAKVANIERDMGRVAHVAERNAERMDAAFKRVGRTFAALGVGGAVGGFALMVKSVADAGDALDNLSQRTGIAADDLSRLQHAAKMSDLSTDDLGAALIRLNRVLGEARDGSKQAGEALRRFGIDPASGIKTAEALRLIAERVKNTGDKALAASALNDVFGKSFAELMPLLQGGAEGLDKFGAEAERLGNVMSPEQARAAAEFNDNLDRLAAGLEGLKRQLAGPLIPKLNDFTQQLLAAADAGRNWREAFGNFVSISGDDAEQPVEAVARLQGKLAEMQKTRDELANSRLAWFSADDIAILDTQIKSVTDKIATLQAYMERTGKTPFAPRGRTGAALEAPDGPAIQPAAAAIVTATTETRKAFDDLNKRLADIASQGFDEQTVSVDTVARQYDAALEQRREAMERMAEERMEAARIETEGEEAVRLAIERTTAAAEKQSAVAADLGFTFASAFEEAVIAGGKLSDVLQGLAQDIQRVILRRMVTEPLAGAISGSLSGLFGGGADVAVANGGVFSGPGIGAYSGRVVSSPTLFPFARGIGLMGEAGPEAILPLKRGPSGKLGVEAAVAGTSVVINNYSGQPATTREVADGRGGRRIEVTVGEMVGAELQRAGSGANRALRNGFGLSPMLVRR